MKKFVIHPAIDAHRLARVVEVAGDVPVVNCQSEQQALEEIENATGFFGKITPQLLAKAKKLTWVQSPTASLEHYLFPELIEHPCQLSNMRGLFYDVIADHVMSYVLCIARNLHIYLAQQRDRNWLPVGGDSDHTMRKDGPGTVTEIDRSHLHLADCTMGVIGVGSIGAEICHRAAAFGIHVVGVDPVVQSVPDVVPEVWTLDRLDYLLGMSDFVVIAAPHTPKTEKLFGRHQFQAMRKAAWLINIGRGIIVDLLDLTQALEENTIAGAALDVFETEPLPVDHPLWSMPNVIITPHIAAASPRISERHLETLLKNIDCHLRDKPPATLVNKRRWF